MYRSRADSGRTTLLTTNLITTGILGSMLWGNRLFLASMIGGSSDICKGATLYQRGGLVPKRRSEPAAFVTTRRRVRHHRDRDVPGWRHNDYVEPHGTPVTQSEPECRE